MQRWLATLAAHTRSARPETISTPESGVDWPEARSLKIISLVLSSGSLLAGSLSMYWLVRMRRSFRHDLIILLISSDLVRSLWLVIYSCITIANSLSTDSATTFCQVSGFFFALGIEASDAAVFLIALHWAVYIFRSNRVTGESSIYPYRYLAFAFYAIFPMLMASLAFLTRFPAYVDTGQYCYLPRNPWWGRMSLSWIPRYINVILIIFMYGASYAYIRTKMRRFSRQHVPIPMSRRERQTPDTPPLICHGLIPSQHESRRISFRVPTNGSLYEESRLFQDDESTGFRNSLRSRLERLSVSSARPKAWPWEGLDWEAGVREPTPASGLVSPRTVDQERVIGNGGIEHGLHPTRPPPSPSGKVSSLASRSFVPLCPKLPECYRRPISIAMEEDEELSKDENLNIGRSRILRGAQMHIFTILQQGPSQQNETAPRRNTVTASLDCEMLASDGVSRDRDRIRRQLRLLFVYPTVYACIWIFPLISDVIGFDKDHFQGPYWVSVASLVSLCVQGLADSIVFCAREKPWRYMQGGFFENMGSFINGFSFDSRNEIGRTREEMFHEGSRARLRREEEMEREQRASRFSPGGTSQASVSRNWWDVELNSDEVGSQDGKVKIDEGPEHNMLGKRRSTQTN
ncbi:hypothetical protein KVR01_003658 [Diaporthe batatas]|uniref:uncharacterized protein n=1 Tax=Diaporthe batatas TaxID=748121 RepID=UPI001D056A00|nr:uncharacterized protein KVR01_003658 [Diaporthe batatas]KAG8167969.1 hypothetical protein KVR01_003658 [Diaporthe batatas]